MLISDTHRLIVMLPPKCGTKTLQQRLKHIHSCAEVGSNTFYDSELKRYLSKHISLKTARRMKAFQDRADFRKVCFVRNPYDRVYSWFCWNLETSKKPLPLRNANQQYEVSSGLVGDEDALRHTRELRLNLQSKMKAAGGDFNRYVELYPGSYKPIHKFTHSGRRSQMDFVGYVERFEADYQEIRNQFGIDDDSLESGNVLVQPHVVDDPRKMQREDYKYLDFFEKKTVKYINKQFKLDFKFYGYQKLNPKDFPDSV